MKDTFLIFSVCQADKTEGTNRDNTAYIDFEYDFQPCLGVYQGTKEESFIADMRDFCTVDNLCRKCNQECFLMCIDGTGWLVYPDKDKECIGKLKIHQEKPEGDHTELFDGTFITFE